MAHGVAWQQPTAATVLPPAVWRQAVLAGPVMRPPAPATALEGGDFAPGDRGFIGLCQAYRASGGIARGSDLAHWLLGRGEGDSRQLAALIVGRQAFSFDWRQTFWVPMFQFSPHAPAWGHGARQVLAELGTVLDGWQLAAWFARPNTWLDNRRPLDLLASNLPLVLAAARTDRYVATG